MNRPRLVSGVKTTLSKFFYFSASYSNGQKVVAHNYILEATAQIEDEDSAFLFERAIEEFLIRKIHSKDLMLHVDFLKGIELNDWNILKAFWEVITEAVAPISLQALSLERDKKTKVTLHESL